MYTRQWMFLQVKQRYGLSPDEQWIAPGLESVDWGGPSRPHRSEPRFIILPRHRVEFR